MDLKMLYHNGGILHNIASDQGIYFITKQVQQWSHDHAMECADINTCSLTNKWSNRMVKQKVWRLYDSSKMRSSSSEFGNQDVEMVDPLTVTHKQLTQKFLLLICIILSSTVLEVLVLKEEMLPSE